MANHQKSYLCKKTTENYNKWMENEINYWYNVYAQNKLERSNNHVDFH